MTKHSIRCLGPKCRHARPLIEALEDRCLLDVTMIPEPALAISFNPPTGLGAPTPVLFGQSATYAIDLTNRGTATANVVTITNVLPQGTTFVSGNMNGTPFAPADNVLECALNQLAAGATVTGTLTLTAHSGSGIYEEIHATTPGALDLSTSSAFYETPVIDRIFATGADQENVPQVNVYDAMTGALRYTFNAYDSRFRGGVRVAIADINGDGVPDIIAAPGPGGGPDVRIFNGDTGALIKEFYAYDPGFAGGVYLAVGRSNDLPTSDPTIITGAGAGGGPHVKVFDARTLDTLGSFYAYVPNFNMGVRVAAGPIETSPTFNRTTRSLRRWDRAQRRRSGSSVALIARCGGASWRTSRHLWAA